MKKENQISKKEMGLEKLRRFERATLKKALRDYSEGKNLDNKKLEDLGRQFS